MSALCLNVCRIWVPNIMSLDVCLKKLHLVKVGAFAWYSVKIWVIFGVHFDRRKVDKTQIYMKTEAYKLLSRVFWIFLPNVIKIDAYDFKLHSFKVVAFFSETQCINKNVELHECIICNYPGGPHIAAAHLAVHLLVLKNFCHLRKSNYTHFALTLISVANWLHV